MLYTHASFRCSLTALALMTALFTTPACAGIADRIDRRANTTDEKITVGGLKREYSVYTPPGIGKHVPLVIVLHGTYGTGEKMQKHLGFDPYARKHGFLVAYPDAYSKPLSRGTTRWNDGRGTLESSQLGVDDVRFIAEMIDDIANKYGIDRTRVFVAGTSNGGMMAYRIGCELKGKVRAIAPEIANIPSPIADKCAPQMGLSILSINGSEDPIIPLNGGQVCAKVSSRFCEKGDVISRSASLFPFSRINGCSPQPISQQRQPQVNDGTSVEDIVYSGCRTNAAVRSIIVHGMGHVWPPNDAQLSSSGPTSQNLDATREIVEFFMAIGR